MSSSIQAPTPYNPLDRLKIWLNGVQFGQTLVPRRLNFSNNFVITEDGNNNFFNIDVVGGGGGGGGPLPTDLAYIDRNNSWSSIQNFPFGSQVNGDNITTNTASLALINKDLTSGTNTFPSSLATLTGSQTLTNKTISATDNTITDASTAAGDLMVSNGTKFIRRAKGTGLQVLRTNSGATDLEWASLQSERVGKSQASGNASTTVFNIAHGLGSNPTYAFIVCSSITNTFTYTTDATNIVVTFTTAPASGTNIVIYWQVIA